MSFLEKRSGAGWNGRAQGFEGMDPADQAMVIRLMQTLIQNEQSLQNPNNQPYVYVTGGDLMAIGFLATGGPDDVELITQAIANGVQSLENNQATSSPTILAVGITMRRVSPVICRRLSSR